MTKDPQNDMPAEEPDELWSLIADVRNWLEWQSECGAEDWAVDDWSAWTKHIPRTRPSLPEDGRGAYHKQTSVQEKAESKRPVSMPPAQPKVPPKPMADIPSAWQHIIENAAPVLNVSALSSGEDGLKSVRAFQQSHCKANKPCQIGYGNILAPVLIVAGDRAPMKPEGFKMLSNMREHVLKLNKSQLYFMDYPLQDTSAPSCQTSLCQQIFHGLLRAQSPKFILVMGEACAVELFGSYGRPVMGEAGELRCLGTVEQPVQAVWTHHPHFLLENGHEKRTVMRHLQNMRRLLLKQGIL